jgi:hypothetical protein
MMRRLFSTESRSRTNARRSLQGMQLRRAQTVEAQVAVDAAAALRTARARPASRGPAAP